jgi:drug/metabolite transporter (DMT)-like permease
LFGERVTRSASYWSAVAFVGTALVVFGASHTSNGSVRGDLLAGLNLFAFTAYFLASKRIRERVGAWEYVVGMTTVSGFVVAAVTLATAQPHGSPAAWEWFVLTSIALFPGTLGHLLANWAHAHVSAFVASMILLAVPVVATAAAYLLLGEQVGSLQFVGGAVVLIAIAVIIRGARRAAAEVFVESAAGGEAP